MSILSSTTTPCLSCGRPVEIPGICATCAADEERMRHNPKTISVLELEPTLNVLVKWFKEPEVNHAEAIRSEIVRLQHLRGYRDPIGKNMWI